MPDAEHVTEHRTVHGQEIARYAHTRSVGQQRNEAGRMHRACGGGLMDQELNWTRTSTIEAVRMRSALGCKGLQRLPGTPPIRTPIIVTSSRRIIVPKNTMNGSCPSMTLAWLGLRRSEHTNRS